MVLKNKNAPPSNEHIIYQNPQHNVLGIEIQNGQDQAVTFVAGGAPDDLPEMQSDSQGSGIYLSFGRMDPKVLKTLEAGEKPWRTRVVEKTGPLEQKTHWLIIDLPEGDDVQVAPDDTLWIPLQFSGERTPARQAGDVDERYRIQNAGTNAGTSGYSVAQFGSKPPEPLSVGIDGNDEVEIQIEGGDQQVPPSTLVLRLRNSSDVPLVQSSSNGAPTFVVSPSTAPADSTPASDVLTSPKFGAGCTAHPENDVATDHWTIDTNKDEKYIHLTPQKEEVLGPNEQALFRIENIKTSFDPGPSNLYVAVRSLPGYRDTTRVVTIDKIRARPTVERFTATADEKGGNKTTYTLNWTTYGYETQTYLKVPSRGIDKPVAHEGSQQITLYQPYASVTLECRNADGSEPQGHAHWRKTLTLEGSPARKGVKKIVYPIFGDIYAYDVESEETTQYQEGTNVLKTTALARSPTHIFWLDEQQSKNVMHNVVRYTGLDGGEVQELNSTEKAFMALGYSGDDCVYSVKNMNFVGNCIGKDCTVTDDAPTEVPETAAADEDKETARLDTWTMNNGADLSKQSKYQPVVFTDKDRLVGVLIVEEGCKMNGFFHMPAPDLQMCAAAGAVPIRDDKVKWEILVYLISKRRHEENFYLRSTKMIVGRRGRGQIEGQEKIMQLGEYVGTGYVGLAVEPKTKDPIWVEPGTCETKPLADLSSDDEQLYRVRRYIRSRDTVADLLQISRPDKPRITNITPEQGLLVLPGANGAA